MTYHFPKVPLRNRDGRYVPAYQRRKRSVIALYSGICAYCGGVASTVDHIVPKSSGGADAEDNLVASCLGCNSSKGKLPLLVWLADRAERRTA